MLRVEDFTCQALTQALGKLRVSDFLRALRTPSSVISNSRFPFFGHQHTLQIRIDNHLRRGNALKSQVLKSQAKAKSLGGGLPPIPPVPVPVAVEAQPGLV